MLIGLKKLTVVKRRRIEHTDQGMRPEPKRESKKTI
jgi:hypothetical protein